MALLTLAEVRALGFTDPPYTDPQVTSAIARIDAYIESVTKNFFEPRTLTLNIDGSGTNVLMMPYPIITITSVKEGGEYEVDLSDLKIYNRHLQGLRNWDQDDRTNPKIEFVRDSFPYFERYSGYQSGFTPGSQNWEIIGTFGYRDYDPLDLVNGQIPPMIKEAAEWLLSRFLAPKGGPKFQQAWAGHSLKKTKTRTQECELGGAIVAGKLHGGLTGDWYLDQLLSMFVAPPLGS